MRVHFKKQSFQENKGKKRTTDILVMWCHLSPPLLCLQACAKPKSQSHRSDTKVRYNFNETCCISVWPKSCLRAANPIMSVKKASKVGAWCFFHPLFFLYIKMSVYIPESFSFELLLISINQKHQNNSQFPKQNFRVVRIY